jgi:hypothetical protein
MINCTKLFAFASVVALLALPLKTEAIIVGLGSTIDNAAEYDQLVSTLTNFGYTITNATDANADIIISTCGDQAYAVVGIPYIKISDWGSNVLDNSYMDITNGDPVTLTLTGSSSILTGVGSTWTGYGFWRYDYSTDYIGWATDGSLNLVSVTYNGTTHTGALALNAAGDSAYVGWNVYGSAATADDLKLFNNLITVMTGGSVIPEPSTDASIAGLVVLGGVFFFRRKRRA